LLLDKPLAVQVVALTGATGFIGTTLRKRLVESGLTVRALSRREEGVHEGIEWIRGSLENTGSLERLVEEADAVIHLAGAVRGSSLDQFNRINVDGSVRLMEAVRRVGASHRFLLMSSLAARHPELSWYAASKREAEQAVQKRAGDLSVTVFRPTAVYGPGDKELRPLFEWLLRGWLLTLGEQTARLSFIHVEDLVRAVVAWVSAPQVHSATYELCDGCPGNYDWQGIAEIAKKIRHGSVRQVTVPAALLQGIAQVNLSLSCLTRRAPMLTPAKVGELRHPNWSCSNTAVEQALGWQPNILLERALEERYF
jgi:nucleoside-diphosphate-sugar epimerase